MVYVAVFRVDGKSSGIFYRRVVSLATLSKLFEKFMSDYPEFEISIVDIYPL